MTTWIARSGPDMAAREPATRWTQLEAELRMLCRSLVNPNGWTSDAVATFVRLPGDAEYRQAIGAIGARLAAEYGLVLGVWRQGDDWCVRFARPVVARAMQARRGESRLGLMGVLRAALAGARAAARRSPGRRDGNARLTGRAWPVRDMLRNC